METPGDKPLVITSLLFAWLLVVLRHPLSHRQYPLNGIKVDLVDLTKHIVEDVDIMRGRSNHRIREVNSIQLIITTFTCKERLLTDICPFFERQFDHSLSSYHTGF